MGGYILKELGPSEVLAQLAEESSELAQAALKMRRAMEGSKNPTPCTLEKATEQLQEEFADVLICMMMLGIDPDIVSQTIERKMPRWWTRLQKGTTPPAEESCPAEDRCPECGAEVEYTGPWEPDDDGATIAWRCPKCGTTGVAGYNFAFDKHYDVKEGEKKDG